MYAYSYSTQSPELQWLSWALLLLFAVAQWMIYEKAGKPGWASIVPIYSLVVLFEIAKINPWKILLLFIPIYNLFLVWKLLDNMVKAFGKTSSFTWGLFMLPYVFFPILAFGKAQYTA